MTTCQEPCIPKLLVTFWTAAASEARRRFGVRPAECSTRTSDPLAAQSAVAAALCRRNPYPSDRSSPTNNFGMHRVKTRTRNRMMSSRTIGSC